jgi:AraC-like DNA-binding protein
MPDSQVSRFTDPHQFQSAIRASTCEVLANSRGGFRAELTRIDLDKLWMQGLQSSDAYILRWVSNADRLSAVFLADAHHAPVRLNGVEFSAREILVCNLSATGDAFFEGRSDLASMSLTPNDLAAATDGIAHRELVDLAETRTLRPAPPLLARLRTFHKMARHLAKDTPDALTRPATVTAIDQELVHALVTCLAGTRSSTSSPRGGCHQKLIGRFEEFLAARHYEPVYLAEICTAIGASERTLRTCCQEHLGMGPIHYLWLRRMHLARRALLGADSAAKSVTEIATTFGFWELGRFSVEYRRLFGELPSATLKHAAVESCGAKMH